MSKKLCDLSNDELQRLWNVLRSTHPSKEELALFSQELLEGTGKEMVEEHLSHCDRCKVTVRWLKEQTGERAGYRDEKAAAKSAARILEKILEPVAGPFRQFLGEAQDSLSTFFEGAMPVGLTQLASTTDADTTTLWKWKSEDGQFFGKAVRRHGSDDVSIRFWSENMDFEGLSFEFQYEKQKQTLTLERAETGGNVVEARLVIPRDAWRVEGVRISLEPRVE